MWLSIHPRQRRPDYPAGKRRMDVWANPAGRKMGPVCTKRLPSSLGFILTSRRLKLLKLTVGVRCAR